ncbi:hypothetical protein IW16_26150 [Chryseobacterium vrystaatense]|uniref:Uncharacterized protein n=1 Tax=Chryseobacterium vrystaatense TaxID=307480 RepID=A0ABR4UGQ0_9FLAO|nr:hypothetical protein IW16_26150 [Chryseobacterium vrystaatense]
MVFGKHLFEISFIGPAISKVISFIFLRSLLLIFERCSMITSLFIPLIIAAILPFLAFAFLEVRTL